MSQPEISAKKWLLEKYFAHLDQLEAEAHNPMETQNEKDLSLESESNVQNESQQNKREQVILSGHGKNEMDFLKQDSFIFGKMMVSRCLLSKCIDSLSEVMAACENIENEHLQHGKEIENKIKFCVKTLNSFDLYYYEDHKVSSQSSSDGSMLRGKHAEYTNDENFTELKSVQGSSSSDNISPTDRVMTRLRNLKDQINALMTNEIGHCKQSFYEILNLGPNESIIYVNTNTCFGKEVSGVSPNLEDSPTCSFSKERIPMDRGLQSIVDAPADDDLETTSDKNQKDDPELALSFTPQIPNDMILPSIDDLIQRLISGCHIIDGTPLPDKQSPRNLNCEQSITACDLEHTVKKGKITECLKCRPNNIHTKSCNKNQSMLREDPLSQLEKIDPHTRVANWVMTIENHGLFEDHDSSKDFCEGSEHEDEKTEGEDEKLRLTVPTTQL